MGSRLPLVPVIRASTKYLFTSTISFEKQQLLSRWRVDDQKDLSNERKIELLKKVVFTTKRLKEGIGNYEKFFQQTEIERFSHSVSLTVFDFFIYRIESSAKKVLLHLRGDPSFEKKWRKFLMQIAILRYESSGLENSKKTEVLITKIVAYIKQRFGDLGLTGEVIDEKLLKLMISYPNGMDSHLFHYLVKGEKIQNGLQYRYHLTIENLLESIAFFYKRMSGNLRELRGAFYFKVPGLVTVLEDAKCPSVLFILNPFEYLDELSRLKKAVGKCYRLTSMKCKEIFRAVQDFKELSLYFDQNQSRSWRKAEYSFFGSNYDKIDKAKQALKLIEQGGISEEEFKKKFGEGYPFQWEEVNLILIFYEECEKFHRMFDTYVATLFYTLDSQLFGFLDWYKKNKRRPNLQSLINRSLSAHTETLEDIDELVKRIGGKKRVIRTKKKNAPSHRPSREIPKEPTQALDSVQIFLSNHLEIPPQPVVKKIVPLLSQLVASQKDLQQKIALRDALVHWDDLTVIVNELQQKKTPSVGGAFSFVRSSYYLLERVLVHAWISQQEGRQEEIFKAGHNLKRMLIKLGQSEKCTDPLIEDLYMAGFWSRRPFQEMTLWEDYKATSLDFVRAPKMLTALNERLKNPSKNIPELSKKQLLEKYEAVKAFVKSFLGEVLMDDQSKFEERVTLSLSPLQIALAKRPQALFRKLSQVQEGADELREADLFYKLLLGSVKAFSQKEMDPISVALRVRQVSFYLTAFIESLLQSLSSVKQGEARDRWSSSHDLQKLYHETFKKTTQEGEMLLAKLKDNHQANRYLFQKPPETPLHHIMMAAELLKENPDLAQGFKLVGNKTVLNFHPVSKAYLDPKNISKELQRILSEAIEFADKELLPELTRSFR